MVLSRDPQLGAGIADGLSGPRGEEASKLVVRAASIGCAERIAMRICRD